MATGLMPAAAGARSVAEKLGICSVYVSCCPIFLPSPHHPPHPMPGRPFPTDVTDNRVLNDLDVQSYNALFGEALNTRRASVADQPYWVGRVAALGIGDLNRQRPRGPRQAERCSSWPPAVTPVQTPSARDGCSDLRSELMM